ncbi:Potassium channel domain, partial [Trinorchestia longiramus]
MESSATSSNVALTNARQEGSNRRSTKCCTKFVSILCSNLGVCLLVLVYTGLGAVLFTSLEGHNMSHHRSLPVKHSPDSPSGDSSDTQVGDAASNPSLGDTAPKSETLRKTSPESGEPTDKTAAAAAVIGSGEFDTQLLRHQTVERLWSITESLNILYRENWTRVVEKELRRYSEELLTSLIRQHNLADEAAASRKRHEDDAQEEFKEQWTFAGSFLYSLTVITTIGYGAVAPQTAVGRVATIVYALMGIPLMLLYLSSVGDLLSRGLKYIWGRLCRCRTPKPGPKLAPPPPPLSLSPPYSHSHNFKNGGCPPDCNNPDHAPIPVTFCMVIM